VVCVAFYTQTHTSTSLSHLFKQPGENYSTGTGPSAPPSLRRPMLPTPSELKPSLTLPETIIPRTVENRQCGRRPFGPSGLHRQQSSPPPRSYPDNPTYLPSWHSGVSTAASQRQGPGFDSPALGSHCLCGDCTFSPPCLCSGFLPQSQKMCGLGWIGRG